MRRYLLAFTISGVALLATAGNRAWSQQPDPRPAPEAARAAIQLDASQALRRELNVEDDFRYGPFVNVRSQTARLVRELSDNKDEAKRADLIRKLETATSEEFDEDMKAREGDLVKMEERIKTLREQLDRRRRAKSDIVQLQLKVFVNDADGLGFSNRSTKDSGRGGPAGASRAVIPFPAPVAPTAPAPPEPVRRPQ